MIRSRNELARWERGLAMCIQGGTVDGRCHSCQRNTKHEVLGSFTRVGHDPYPEWELQILKSNVDAFFRKLGWPDPASGWDWLLGDMEEGQALEEDVQGIIEELHAWLDSSGNLQQEFWSDEITTWQLFRQKWQWIDILRACNAGLEWEERWQVVECRGCKTPSFQLCTWSEVDTHRDSVAGQLLPREFGTTQFPPEAGRRLPSWAPNLPMKIRRVLEETYSALNAELFTLASIGIRTALDLALAESDEDDRKFVEKLRSHSASGRITEDDRQVLDAIIKAGNASAHGAHSPRNEDFRFMVEQTEAFLYRRYVAHYDAQGLKQRTPQKKPVKRPKGQAAN